MNVKIILIQLIGLACTVLLCTHPFSNRNIKSKRKLTVREVNRYYASHPSGPAPFHSQPLIDALGGKYEAYLITKKNGNLNTILINYASFFFL